MGLKLADLLFRFRFFHGAFSFSNCRQRLRFVFIWLAAPTFCGEAGWIIAYWLHPRFSLFLGIHGLRPQHLWRMIATPNKSLQATRDGGSSSASRFTSFGPACLSSDRKSTRLNSSHLGISYAVVCL